MDRAQEFLLPPSMVDWLPEDHLVWFVIAAVDRLDTAAFHALARLGGVGRRGFDPDMLLTLFVYAMAHGVRSSRQIERLCGTDVAFRIICAGDVPDHSVLARFRQRHEAALGDLLGQTLSLCAELGMVRLGVVALDGTKIAANAAKDANYTEAHLRRLADEYLSDMQARDAAEDEAFGEDARGDEVPETVRDRTGRAKRIDQALEQIRTRRKAAEQAEREAATAAARYAQDLADTVTPPKGRPRAGTDPEAAAKARWERARARRQADIDAWHAKAAEAAEQGRELRVRRPVPADEHCRVRKARAAYEAAMAKAAAQPEPGQPANGPDAAATTDTAASGGAKVEQDKANLTDPQSRLMKTRNGWIQGYNCQGSVSEDEFIITADVTQDANDVQQFQPVMEDVAQASQKMATHTGRRDLDVGHLLADAGYDSDDNLTAEG
ncbi:transposase, partial [Actinopolymorpha alba]|uniref:transposase n=1 Tax=Actinopolymorpha alba TaxID=533267 RepID=UPI000476842C